MKILMPGNVFTAIFILNLSEEFKANASIQKASMITQDLLDDKCDVAIIPSFDLIKNENLFVSSKLAISFDGPLANAYYKFPEHKLEIKNLFLRGDVSKNEVMASQIVFQELYKTKLQIVLDTEKDIAENNSYLFAGNSIFDFNWTETGISIAEQVSELINLPYVNFIFASKSEEKLRQLNKLIESLDEKVINNIDTTLDKFDYESKVNSFIKKNLDSVYFEMTDNETEALKELYKFSYFFKFADDIFDIKFV